MEWLSSCPTPYRHLAVHSAHPKCWAKEVKVATGVTVDRPKIV